MPEKHIVTGVGGAVVGVLAGVALGGSGTENKINTGMKRAFEPVQEVTASLNDRIGALEEVATTNAAALSEAMASSNEALTARIDDIEAMLGTLEGGLSDKLSAATAEQTAALQAGFADLKAGAGGGAVSPTEAGAEKTAVDTEAAGTSAVSEGLTVGKTAVFGETRVFVSLADEAAGKARLAVNGALATLAVGESHDTGADCSVTLDGVAQGAVSVSSDCGGPAPTVTAAPSDDGDPVDGASPGETVLLADGALRVFVSSVLGTEGARLAINGVETATVAAGESVEVQAGDQTCTVTVVATGGGEAAVEGSCS